MQRSGGEGEGRGLPTQRLPLLPGNGRVGGRKRLFAVGGSWQAGPVGVQNGTGLSVFNVLSIRGALSPLRFLDAFQSVSRFRCFEKTENFESRVFYTGFQLSL